MDKLQEVAKELQKPENEMVMKAFSELANTGIAETKEIVKELSESPKFSEQAISFLWSDKTSNDLKIYKSGYEEGKAAGYSEGNKAGIIKGSLASVALMAAGWYFLNQNKKK